MKIRIFLEFIHPMPVIPIWEKIDVLWSFTSTDYIVSFLFLQRSENSKGCNIRVDNEKEKFPI